MGEKGFGRHFTFDGFVKDSSTITAENVTSLSRLQEERSGTPNFSWVASAFFLLTFAFNYGYYVFAWTL